MRPNQFRKQTKYFHYNFSYFTHANPALRALDWIFIQKAIQSAAKVYAQEIHAIVMMDTHIHFISSGAISNENFFSTDIQRAIGFADIENLCEPISTYAQFLNTYKYVYRNPVEAGLCSRAEDYVFSSLSGLLGRQELKLSVIDPLGLIQNPVQVLSWLNEDRQYKNSQINWLRSD